MHGDTATLGPRCPQIPVSSVCAAEDLAVVGDQYNKHKHSLRTSREFRQQRGELGGRLLAVSDLLGASSPARTHPRSPESRRFGRGLPRRRQRHAGSPPSGRRVHQPEFPLRCALRVTACANCLLQVEFLAPATAFADSDVRLVSERRRGCVPLVVTLLFVLPGFSWMPGCRKAGTRPRPPVD